jgi:hypothetical protein
MWRAHGDLGHKRAGALCCSVGGCAHHSGIGFDRLEQLEEHVALEHPKGESNAEIP